MGKRYLRVIALACLGIAAIISLQGTPRIAQVLSPMDPARNPVYAVQAFYKAVERGDWLKARALTTREYWSKLETEGQITTWQERHKQDETLQFTGFSLQQSSVERETAVINGRAVWVSALGTVPRNTETITLVQGLGGWYISSIETKESSAIVESFYMYLSQGEWEQAKAQVQPDTWRGLESRGIISRLKQEYARKSGFVTALSRSVREEGNQALVQVDLVWLTPGESRAQTTVKLSKSGSRWLIRQIEGGWPR